MFRRAERYPTRLVAQVGRSPPGGVGRNVVEDVRAFVGAVGQPNPPVRPGSGRFHDSGSRGAKPWSPGVSVGGNPVQRFAGVKGLNFKPEKSSTHTYTGIARR